MVVLYGTLGFSPQKFLGAVPAVGEKIERVVVYTAAATETNTQRSEAAYRKVREALRAIVDQCEHRRFSSPWNFDEIARGFIQDIAKEDPRRLVFNLTGGPKTMTVAATIACLVHGVRTLYVAEESEGIGAPFALPLLRIRYSQFLTEAQAKLLDAIKKYEPGSLDELADILRRSNATITFHTQKLEEIGALTFLSDPKNRLLRSPRLTFTGEIMLMAERTLAKTEASHEKKKAAR